MPATHHLCTQCHRRAAELGYAECRQCRAEFTEDVEDEQERLDECDEEETFRD